MTPVVYKLCLIIDRRIIIVGMKKNVGGSVGATKNTDAHRKKKSEGAAKNTKSFIKVPTGKMWAPTEKKNRRPSPHFFYQILGRPQ